MTLSLRYMTVNDLAQVLNIDRLSFPTPWSQHSYMHEITEANYSHMLTLEQCEQTPVYGFQRWLRRLTGQNGTTSKSCQVIGYGGLWNIAEEAHISTIAVHPDYRRQGWGEVLLVAMVMRAITLHAEYVVLEVRVSNTVARSLYEKYGFVYTRTKAGYYRDNYEDADEMQLTLDETACAQVQAAHQRLLAKHDLIDRYTEGIGQR